MKKGKISIVLAFVLTISLVVIASASTAIPLSPTTAAESDFECTGYIVTGQAAGGQSIICKNRDSSNWHEGVALVIPDDGFKHIIIETDIPTEGDEYGEALLHGINEKGVGGATFAGTAIEEQRTPDEGITPAELAQRAIQYSATAEEFVKAFEANLYEYGCSTKGGSLGCVDVNEGWVCEYTPKTTAMEGPIVDDYRIVSNQYQIRSMKQYEGTNGAWNRIRRATQILESELYPNFPGEPWERTWNLKLAFAFPRDNYQQFPEWWASSRPINAYNEGGEPGGTVSAGISIPDEEFPGLLTTLWWAMDNPRNAPYIPLYIGITDVPDQIESYGTYESKDTFNKLRLLMHQDLDLREPLVMAVWAGFEARQFERTEELEAEVRALARDGQIDEAQELLTDFLQTQVDEVMSLLNQLVDQFEA